MKLPIAVGLGFIVLLTWVWVSAIDLETTCKQAEGRFFRGACIKQECFVELK